MYLVESNGLVETQPAVPEDERQRLQRDLHDTLGPALAGIRLRLEAAAARLPQNPGVRQLIVDAVAETTRTMEEIRRIVHNDAPLDLQLGLPDALRRLTARLAAPHTAIDVDVPDTTLRLLAAVEVAAYRIAAEGLTNVIRHSAARHVTVRLTADEDHVVLEIADDGVGISRTMRARGHGLSSMLKRAREVDGNCDVLSRPEAYPGTLVRTVLPRRPA